MPRLRFLAFAAGASLLTLAAGCSSAWRRTQGEWVPGKSLSSNPSILLLPVLGREPEACQEMTGALLGDLSKKGYRVVGFVGQESGIASLDRATTDGFDYVLEGNLTKWEDKGSGDEAELLVKLYEVSSRQMVAEATHYAHGRAGHWPSDPSDFIPELADCTLARIFGWTPAVYKGDPD